jgi:hypothetical protein
MPDQKFSHFQTILPEILAVTVTQTKSVQFTSGRHPSPEQVGNSFIRRCLVLSKAFQERREIFGLGMPQRDAAENDHQARESLYVDALKCGCSWRITVPLLCLRS